MSAAAIMPSGIGIMASTFAPGPSRNMAFIAMSAMASLGSVVGSLLGGFVGSTLGWKWVFWIPAVASAVTTAAGWFVTAGHTARIAPQGTTENAESSKKSYVDWIGGGLISSSLTLLLVAITQGNVSGWSTPWIPPLLVVSVLLLGGFIFYQRRLEIDPDRIPLMPNRSTKDWGSCRRHFGFFLPGYQAVSTLLC
ncbi:aminotriazole resistance protein [Fusarium bulbicola]|nr:aminotriazole resistance protein [Fusarium bulbicola]